MTTPQRDAYAATSAEDPHAVLGKGVEFEGKLTFEGMVRIDGRFTGQITTNDTLVIGEGARVSAEISCGTVIVRGELNGNIKAKTSVELHNPGKIRGDIYTPSLTIEKGVFFQGSTKMENLEKELSRYDATATKHSQRNGPAMPAGVAEIAS